MATIALKLGDLEIATLEAIWAAGALTAQQIHKQVGEQRAISLQTIQSTLERLFKKSVLVREKVSHSYVYSAQHSREAVLSRLLHGSLKRFSRDRKSDLMGAFVTAVETCDEAGMQDLERLLAAHKKDHQT